MLRQIDSERVFQNLENWPFPLGIEHCAKPNFPRWKMDCTSRQEADYGGHRHVKGWLAMPEIPSLKQ